MQGFYSTYLELKEKIKDDKLIGLLEKLYEAHYIEMITKEAIELYYRGYKEDEIIEEIVKYYKDELSKDRIEDIIKKLMLK